MLSQERLYHIMSLIHTKSFISIADLMQDLHVSKSTVNRDLIELEKQGLIKRERGGAVLKKMAATLSSFNEVSVNDKEFLQTDEKKQVCDQAAQTIQDGECIYIDSGTTSTWLLPHLAGRHLKLVTVSPYLLQKLPPNFIGDVYLLGGEFSPRLNMSMGPMTMELIERFNFDRAYLTTNGVNAETGEVYIFDFAVGAIKSAVMKRSQQNYLLIDDTKFNTRGLCTWTYTGKFDRIFVNSFPSHLEMPDNYVLCG